MNTSIGIARPDQREAELIREAERHATLSFLRRRAELLDRIHGKKQEDQPKCF